MRKILAIWVCFALSINVLSVVPVKAFEVSPTPATEFFDAAPLLITGYQTTADATSLMAVEVYNQADVAVDMQSWALEAMTKDTAAHPVVYTTTHAGMLLPGEHVTMSVSAKTTYQIQSSVMGAITSIELHSNEQGKNYRVVTAPIKDTTDAPFFRTYTTTGYSTASQPFASSPARAFYDDGLYMPPSLPIGLKVVEVYPYSSDCAPNDSSLLCGDYIKLKNTSENPIVLDDLALRTDYYGRERTSSNTILLYGDLAPGATTLVNTTNNGDELSLTNSGGYVWLEDAWGMARYDETLQSYQSDGIGEQGYAYALGINGIWQWTTTPQPVGENIITLPVEVLAECPIGKYRNPETGRCRTIEEAVNALTECEEGYERNPTTNRCRKTVVTAAATITPCKEGQERNPATNRCRSIASAVAELLPCDEGYERSVETNRCRKLKSDTVPQAAFPVTPVRGMADTAGWYALAAVGAVAAGYAIWEWRVEIAESFRKLFGGLRRGK